MAKKSEDMVKHIEKYFGILKDSPESADKWIDSINKARKVVDVEFEARQERFNKLRQ